MTTSRTIRRMTTISKNSPRAFCAWSVKSGHVADAAQLRVDLVLPVAQAEAARRTAVEARVVGVADDLEGVRGAVGELEDVDQEIAQAVGRRLRLFASEARAALGVDLVDRVQLVVEELVVRAQLDELRVGELRERRRADRHDHALLDLQSTRSVLSAVDDVHHRHRDRGRARTAEVTEVGEGPSSPPPRARWRARRPGSRWHRSWTCSACRRAR